MSMELIDRDRAIRIAEQGQVKGFEWQFKQLVTEPPVKAIPLEKLEQIKARIELEKLGYPPSAGYYKAIMKVLEIIDKALKEQNE